MSDTQTLILISVVSFVVSAAVATLRKGSLNQHLVKLGLCGLAIIAGYFLAFGSTPDPADFEKLMAAYLIITPGLSLVVFLSMIPGYMFGALFRKTPGSAG